MRRDPVAGSARTGLAAPVVLMGTRPGWRDGASLFLRAGTRRADARRPRRAGSSEPMPRSLPSFPTRAPELGVPLEDAPFAPGPVEAPPEVSLRVNFYWTLAGHVVAAGCKWLELTLLAKAGTRDMVGQFAYALALTAPVVMLTNLQLRAVQATDAQWRLALSRRLNSGSSSARRT